MRKAAIGGIIGIALILVAVYFLNNHILKPPRVKTEPKQPAVTAPAPVKPAEKTPEVSEPPPQKEAETSAPAPAQKPETPVPAARSLLDVGLEGRWEMVELSREGKKQNDQLAVEMTRVGNNLEISFKPGGPEMMLYNRPDQMRLITQDESRNEQIIVNVKRYASDQQGNWRVSDRLSALQLPLSQYLIYTCFRLDNLCCCSLAVNCLSQQAIDDTGNGTCQPNISHFSNLPEDTG